MARPTWLSFRELRHGMESHALYCAMESMERHRGLAMALPKLLGLAIGCFAGNQEAWESMTVKP